MPPRTKCYSASSSFWLRNSWSLAGLPGDILNESPRLSYHNPTINLERRLHHEKSYSYQEEASKRNSTNSVSNEIHTNKPVEELVREISTLEHEIIHKERHLLSLYRSSFDQYLVSSPAFKSPSVNSLRNLQNAGSLRAHKGNDHEANPDESIDRACQFKGFKVVRDSSSNLAEIKLSRADTLAANEDNENVLSDIIDTTPVLPKIKTKRMSGHQSLAAHLGASIMDHVPEVCCKLSEDIIKCISAIYYKLASPPSQSTDQLASPTPSVSSSSTISRRDPANDNWSPNCHYESDKDKNGENNIIIEVKQLHIDGERFRYASEMLMFFRCLVRRLETINPKKMAYEEQLAFWINIHNALIMHALLAYGLHKHMKSTLYLLKAAYNIGGLSVNAYHIQSSILRCQPHLPSLWFGKLMIPAFKWARVNDRHPYALDHAEPLVHFALCSGASSDPVLRVYRAKSIHQDLEISKAEFIQSNVSVFGKSTVILPKILQHYAKDTYLKLEDILEIVCKYISEAQQKIIQGCYKKRHEKCVIWSTSKPSFRYFVHPDLAKQYVTNASYS